MMKVKQPINANGIAAAKTTDGRQNAGRVFRNALLLAGGIALVTMAGGCDKAPQNGNAQVSTTPPAAGAVEEPKKVEVSFVKGLPVWSMMVEQVATPEAKAEMIRLGMGSQEIEFNTRYAVQKKYWEAIMSRPPIELAGEVQDKAFVRQAVGELHGIYTESNWRPTILALVGVNQDGGKFYAKYGNRNLSLMEAWTVFRALEKGEKPKSGEYAVMGVGEFYTAYGIVLVGDLIKLLSEKAGIPSPMTKADLKVYGEADAFVRKAMENPEDREKTLRAMAQEIIEGVNYQNKEYRVWSILLDSPGAYY